MPKKLNKSVSLLIAIILLLAPLQSTFANLIGEFGPYKLLVENRVSATDPTPIVGAEYEVFRISTLNDDGTATPVDPELSLGKFTIDATGENGFQTNIKGQYRIVPTKRAPGYLLGQSFTVEFPRMKCEEDAEHNPINCVVAPDAEQVVTVYPKIIKLLGSVELLKWTTGETAPIPLPGAVFKLWQDTEIPADSTKTYPFDMGNYTTDSDGKIVVENLPEGTYRFCEITAPDGYGPIPAEPNNCVGFSITAPVDATANPERVTVDFQNYPIPEIIKTVDGNADGAGADHNIGEPFYYTLTFPIPENISTFTYYRVIDSFPEAIDYISHTVAPTNLTDSEVYDETTHKLTIAFNIAALANAYNAGQRSISVTINVKLNANAEHGVPVINVARLEWDHGSDEDDEPVRPHEGAFDIKKRDSAGNPLAGVGFQLFTDAAATVPFISPITGQPVIVESGADGIVHFTRLPYGTYYVKEVYVPEGYRISDVITEVVVPVADTFELIITNYSVDETLPVTGTLGALIFLGAGVLLIGAGIFFAKRKKNDKI